MRLIAFIEIMLPAAKLLIQALLGRKRLLQKLFQQDLTFRFDLISKLGGREKKKKDDEKKAT